MITTCNLSCLDFNCGFLLLKIAFFPADMMAYNRLWIIGDDFGSRSFEHYYRARKTMDYNAYAKAYFDVSGFFSNFLSDNPSILSRIGNLLVQAIESKNNTKYLPLPKIVVIVLDDDLIKALCSSENMKGFSKPMSRLLNFLMTEFECNVESFKENLPAKCVKSDFPHFLWIQVPLHENFGNNSLRFKFNKCLEDTARLHQNCSTLRLKKVWDTNDSNLFIKESQHFTAEGFRCYWEAVDKTRRYCDSVLLKKQEKKKQKAVLSAKFSIMHTEHFKSTEKISGDQKDHTSTVRDRFRWQNPALNISSDVSLVFRKLPPPPSRSRDRF